MCSRSTPGSGGASPFFNRSTDPPQTSRAVRRVLEPRFPPDAVTRLLPLVLVLVLAACGSEPPEADVTGLRLQREGTAYPTLQGTLVNRGPGAISSADVFVTLYDAQNRPMDDVLVQVRNVADGDSARFEQRLDLQAGAAKLKYVGVN